MLSARTPFITPGGVAGEPSLVASAPSFRVKACFVIGHTVLASEFSLNNTIKDAFITTALSMYFFVLPS